MMAIKTYGNIFYRKRSNEWVIDSAEPHVCIRLKNVFPKISRTRTVPFEFENTPENCHDLLWFIDRYPLSITDKDKNLMFEGRHEYHYLQNELEQIFSPDYTPVKVTLKEP